MAKKSIIASKNAPAAIGPYSQAIKAGELIFVSGQLPIDPAQNKIVAQNISEQTHQSIKNLQAILLEAGSSLDNVVKTTCYLADMSLFAEMNAVYSQYFKTDCPARAAFAVKQLPLDALVEIECVALA